MAALTPEVLEQLADLLNGRDAHRTKDKNKSKFEDLSKKLDQFNGEDFHNWIYRFRSAVASLYNKQAVDKLDEVLNRDQEIDMSAMDEDHQLLSQQMHWLLVEKVRGAPSDTVKNTPSNNGYEALRKLKQRYDARTVGRRVQLIRKVVSPPKIKNLKDAMSTIERWEANVRRLKEEYGEDLSPGLKTGVIMEMLPNDTLETLLARLPDHGRDTLYQETRDMITTLVERKIDLGNGPKPMDLDGLGDTAETRSSSEGSQEEELNRMGFEGNQKGKGKGFKGLCWNCRGPGHSARFCPWTEGGKGAYGKKGLTKGGPGKGGKSFWEKGDAPKGKGKSSYYPYNQFYQNPAHGYGKGKGKDQPWKGKGQTYGLGDEYWPSASQNEWGTFALCSLEATEPSSSSKITKTAEIMDYTKVKPDKKKKKSKKNQKKTVETGMLFNRFSVLFDEEEDEAGALEEIPALGSLNVCGKDTKGPWEAGNMHDQEDKDEKSGDLQAARAVPAPPPEWCSRRGGRVMDKKALSRIWKDGARNACMDHLTLEPCQCGSPPQSSTQALVGVLEVQEQLHHVHGPEWVKLEMVMDSGAAESVAPADLAPWVEIQESTGSKAGRKYLSACGEVLQNLGEKHIQFHTEEGMQAKTTFQIADVTRPLCSVAKVCDQGNTVVFHATGGFVEDAYGKRTHFERVNNIYTMCLYAQDPGSNADKGFSRQS